MVHQGRVALPGPRKPRRGPDRGCLEHASTRARRQPRAADPADPRRPGEGRLPPLPRALRHPARRGEPAHQRLHPLHRGATATRAWCMPRPTPRRIAVRPALRAPERDAAGGHRGDTPADRRRRPHRDRRDHPARRAPKRSSPPTSSWSRPGPPTAPGCCCPRPTTPIRNGLANGSDQVGRNYMFHNSKAVVALAQGTQRDRLPEDARAERLLLRRPRLRLPVGQHPDGRQVQCRGHEGRRTSPHARWRRTGRLADVSAHAVDFWLTTEDLPWPENRVTLDGEGTVHLGYTATNDKEAEQPLRAS